MLYNELIFILHTIVIAATITLAARMGKQALITIMALQAILANLFVTQEITLCTLTITSTDMFAVGGSLALNLILEYYDRKTAYQAIVTSCAALIFYTLMAYFHLSYMPAATDVMHPHFSILLNSSARLLGASLCAYGAAQISDFILYRLLQKKLRTWFTVRNYIVLSISQLVDTCTFAFVGLYGIVSSISSVIFASYSIKIISIVLITSILSLIRPDYQKHP